MSWSRPASRSSTCFRLLTKAVPSPLVTIVVLTAITWFFGFDLRTVGDMGELPDTLPVFLIPDIPLNLETLLIILPYSVAVAAVGLLESLMTAVHRRRSHRYKRRTATWNASARASPTPRRASSAAWPAAP
jgi:MFS superfamily sulfate permease-like transporter